MAGRGRSSFQKKQKEQVRQERRQQKAARKQERTLTKETGEPDESDLEGLLGPILDEVDRERGAGSEES